LGGDTIRTMRVLVGAAVALSLAGCGGSLATWSGGTTFAEFSLTGETQTVVNAKAGCHLDGALVGDRGTVKTFAIDTQSATYTVELSAGNYKIGLSPDVSPDELSGCSGIMVTIDKQ